VLFLGVILMTILAYLLIVWEDKLNETIDKRKEKAEKRAVWLRNYQRARGRALTKPSPAVSRPIQGHT
jgi:hypothetical protein